MSRAERAISPKDSPPPPKGLSVTALYTAGIWRWGEVEGSELCVDQHSLVVRRVVNAFLAIARLFRRDLPRVPEGLIQRHRAIDHLVEISPWGEVLELAAGLSTRSFRMQQRWPRRHYTELDLPQVISYKSALLAERGPALLESETFRLVEGDVGATALRDVLSDAGEGPLLVIAEGLLMYLSEAAQRALFTEVAGVMRERGGVFLFDLVPAPEQPKSGVIGRTLGALMRHFTEGESFVIDQRGRREILEELRLAGFEAPSCASPAEILGVALPFPTAHTQQLIFRATVKEAEMDAG